MDKIVLSDASPIIILSQVNGLIWLKHLFGKVLIPKPVYREIITGQGKSGEEEIKTAISLGFLSILKEDWKDPIFPYLDEGEASCIRAGVHLRSPCLILMDDKEGRETAREYGLNVTGIAAVIGTAKQKKLIPSASAVFDSLLKKNFRISAEVIRTVLEQAGER